MNFMETVFENDERIIFKLRELYSKYGYTKYRMSKFEEYDIYVRNKDFLISENIITFTDVDGKLMALKPDVTLSIIKNSRDTEYGVQKMTTRGYENEREGGARCAICFKLRLEETAKKAKECCFDLFGTTLTVSPHKNAELINSIGLGIEKELDIKFLVSNFKKQNGYKRSVELSKENNIYRQSYCGCEFALNIQKIEAPESLKKIY